MSTNLTSSRSDKFLGCGLLIVVLVSCFAFLAMWFWPQGTGLNPHAAPRPVDARGKLSDFEESNIKVYAEAAPAVVHVTNMFQTRSALSFDLQQIPQGTGSGFIWDTDGHIVTNHHVVSGADAARVVLADHTSYDAIKIWSYPEKDIAVIWINAPKSKLRPILIGTSHDLKVGQITYAIGNPFGLDHTMTQGIVSALGREVQLSNGYPLLGAVQTSAAINPGNSGGPLLDSSGRLIGMNAAIVSNSGSFAGIGFAIPVDEINQVVPQLIQGGKVSRPRIGVQLADDQLAQHLGISDGALILKVLANSPAAAAGLKGTGLDAVGNVILGDVIVGVDDQTVSSPRDLDGVLASHKVGDTVTLTIVRKGERQQVQVTLKAADQG